jgi:hypothetical protein
MKIKFRDLHKAVDHLRFQSGIKEDMEVDVIVREEDLSGNKICDSISLSFEASYTPGQYDNIKTNTLKQWTLEIFAVSENRPARLTCISTQELEFKKD